MTRFFDFSERKMTDPTHNAMFNEDGTFVDKDALHRAKVLNVVAGSLGALWWSVTLGSYFQLFARALGAGEVTIGLLATIPSLAHVFQIASAWFVERIGRRKKYWAVTEATRRIVLALMPLLPFVFIDDFAVARALMLVTLGLSSVLGSAGFTPWYSWMADIIPERERGRFFGMRSAIVNLAVVILLPVFGRILDVFSEERQFVGFAIVFGAAAVIGLIDIVVHSFIPEPPMRRDRERADLAAMIVRPLKDSNFRRFFFGWGLWSFASFVTVPFYAVYFRETLGVDFAFIGVVNSVGLFVAMAGSAFWGSVADRLGSKPVFNICAVASIPLPVFFFFATPENARTVLIIQAAVGGVLGSGMNSGFTNLLMGLSPREGRSMFIAVFFTVTGVVTSVAPIVGGLIGRACPEFFFNGAVGGMHAESFFGGLTRYHNLMLISMVLYVFCLPLFFRIREVSAASVGVVLGNLMMTNPVRTFARIGILKAGRSARASALAARSLGGSRARLASEDLLARLDDPSVVVRDEAINALGEIGDPAAVDPLLERLEHPEAHSVPAIIRSLGLIGDSKALWPLVGLLADDDIHVRAAAARALGELGDRRAVAALKELIQREGSQLVLANAVEALGEIGARADMWEIMPLLKDVKNPILKRQTALAVGNLLGGRDEFYRILSVENRDPGREVERLIKRLRRRLPRGRESAELAEAFARFLDAYNRRDCRRCVRELGEAAYLIARDAYDFQGPRDVLLEVAVLRDDRFAAGLWFLHVLETGEMPLTIDDALLALYLMASGTYADAPPLA
jgi:HEAT repeat protein/MFS family permease